jgi:hypothetical protein
MTDVGHRRLASQRLAGVFLKSPLAAVRHFGAIQAQDFAMAKWALGVRLPTIAEQQIAQAIDKGDIVRTHVLRPTWHLVPAEDLSWMLDLSARRIASQMKGADSRLGIDAKLIAKCNDLVGQLLDNKKHLTRTELMAHLGVNGIKAGQMRASHLMLHAEIDKIVCSGKRRGGEHTYAGFSHRIPKPVALPEDQALAKLAARYFQSHGPASLRDFIWWSGLPVSQAGKALASVADKFRKIEAGGQEMYYKPSEILCTDSVLLLPAFDEFLIAYADRSAVIRDLHRAHAFTSNGIFRPVVVAGGQVCGTWKRTVKNHKAVIEPNLLEKLTGKQLEMLHQAGIRFALFLGKEAEIKM